MHTIQLDEETADSSETKIKAPPTAGDAPEATRRLRAMLDGAGLDYTCTVRKIIDGKRVIVAQDDNSEWGPNELAKNFGEGKFDLWFEWRNQDGTKGSASYMIPIGGNLYAKMHRDFKREQREIMDTEGRSSEDLASTISRAVAQGVSEAVKAIIPSIQPQQQSGGFGTAELIAMMRADADRREEMQTRHTELMMRQQELAQQQSSRMTEAMFGFLGQQISQKQTGMDHFAMLEKTLTLTKGMVEVRNMVTTEPAKEDWLDRLGTMAEKFAPVILPLLVSKPVAKQAAAGYLASADESLLADLSKLKDDPSARARATDRLASLRNFDRAKAAAAIDILVGAMPNGGAQAQEVVMQAPAVQIVTDDQAEGDEEQFFTDDQRPDTVLDIHGNRYDMQGNLIEAAPTDPDAGGDDFQGEGR